MQSSFNVEVKILYLPGRKYVISRGEKVKRYYKIYCISPYRQSHSPSVPSVNFILICYFKLSLLVMKKLLPSLLYDPLTFIKVKKQFFLTNHNS